MRSAAQVNLPINRTPSPSPPPGTPRPSVTPQPTPTSTPEPSIPIGASPTPSPPPDPSPDPFATPGPPAGGPTPAPAVLPGIPPGFHIPVIKRTAPRNTVKLVKTLERATQVGMPLDQALAEGMGRFPVQGLAFYSDDWMNLRYVPIFHLHEGLDIFADFGTPIRAPDKGVVTRLVQGPIGGIALWMTGRDGTQYYFAHMQGYAGGIAEGTPVEIGTTVGFVGDSGNAKGGAPHMHFEIHRGEAIPPKPLVDAWLDEAERAAPTWVEARIRAVVGEREVLRGEHALAGLLAQDTMRPSGTPEYSILLTVLDPVGGSLGLLPDLPLVPRRASGGSSRLIDELIRQRVDGSLLSSLVLGDTTHTDSGG